MQRTANQTPSCWGTLSALLLTACIGLLVVGCVADEDDPGAMAEDCATTHCGAEQSACTESASCSTIVGCATACASSACVDTCKADADGPTGDIFDTYWGCLAANTCFGTQLPPDNSSCLDENCADEVAGCETADCAAYIDCVVGCSGSENEPQCASSCAMDNSDAADAYIAQFTCEQEHCAAE